MIDKIVNFFHQRNHLYLGYMIRNILTFSPMAWLKKYIFPIGGEGFKKIVFLLRAKYYYKTRLRKYLRLPFCLFGHKPQVTVNWSNLTTWCTKCGNTLKIVYYKDMEK